MKGATFWYNDNVTHCHKLHRVIFAHLSAVYDTLVHVLEIKKSALQT